MHERCLVHCERYLHTPIPGMVALSTFAQCSSYDQVPHRPMVKSAGVSAPSFVPCYCQRERLHRCRVVCGTCAHLERVSKAKIGGCCAGEIRPSGWWSSSWRTRLDGEKGISGGAGLLGDKLAGQQRAPQNMMLQLMRFEVISCCCRGTAVGLRMHVLVHSSASMHVGRQAADT